MTTDEEQRVTHELQHKVSAFVEGLQKTRRSLNADELASMASPRARLEVPLDAVDAYVFTIDGVLQGEKLTGALLGGECMLIRANTASEALELANAGLRETVRLLHEEYETRGQRDNELFMTVDAGGRRMKPSEGEPLKHMPELRGMIERVMRGGK